MPAFDDSTTTSAPVEEVWKLLYDPSRLVEWWDGVERVEPHGTDGKGDMTIWTSRCRRTCAPGRTAAA
jgi:uncharacterized protein YndB with AHSA1/START domain